MKLFDISIPISNKTLVYKDDVKFEIQKKITKIDILKVDNIEIGSYIRNTLQLDKARSREEALFELFKILRRFRFTLPNG